MIKYTISLFSSCCMISCSHRWPRMKFLAKNHVQLTPASFNKTSGYNFKSAEEIEFHLEPTAAGPSTVWARSIARRLGCYVALGYPEYCAHSPSSPQGSMSRYNSAVLVSPKGNVLVNYRKSFLFDTDETWAEEGREGFFAGEMPDGLGRLAMGICKFPRSSPTKNEYSWRQVAMKRRWDKRLLTFGSHRHGSQSATIRNTIREL